ncbi:hypothetical protein [Polyangium mundeleinium]|uniref:Uncharacterized protein n=1 Tax=Polyangium mundeleinium TaxID=2995306 RepID=A0ABT5EXN8_9BACT|nr:hypothetical protein [Polyangium mundeleinium]MDC0745692.1 hypothetical protein [Polyangium mundeleinium]
MDNKVGDALLTPEQHIELLAQLKTIVEKLRAHGITLTVDDRKRTLRQRRGADPHIQRVIDLAKQHNVSLKSIPLAGLENDLILTKQLLPIEEELRVALQLAEDTGTQAGSEAWEAFLAYYGVLSSMGERMPDLAAELQTVVDFMATGPRKKAQAT